MIHNPSNIQYTKHEADIFFQTVVSTDIKTKNAFADYLAEEYIDGEASGLTYSDIGEIAGVIVAQFQERRNRKFSI